MQDHLSIILEMNKEPLQQHAKKLMEEAEAEVWENELHLMRVAELMWEDYQIRQELEANLRYQIFAQMQMTMEYLNIKHPKIKMWCIMNSELTDEENSEEILDCKTLEELKYLIADNIVNNLMSIETTEMTELDRTMSGYNDEPSEVE